MEIKLHYEKFFDNNVIIQIIEKKDLKNNTHTLSIEKNDKECYVYCLSKDKKIFANAGYRTDKFISKVEKEFDKIKEELLNQTMFLTIGNDEKHKIVYHKTDDAYYVFEIDEKLYFDYDYFHRQTETLIFEFIDDELTLTYNLEENENRLFRMNLNGIKKFEGEILKYAKQNYTH